MSACYECSLCRQQYSDLDPAIRCCAADKAAMTGISGQALMSLTQAAEEAERERIVAWLQDKACFINAHDIADAIKEGEHLK